MKEITPLLAQARDCLRGLWNQHYRHLCTDADPFDVIDSYKQVRSQVARDFLRFGGVSLSNLDQIKVKLIESVQPRSALAKQRTGPQVVNWNPCDSRSELDQLFRFVDFFDFGETDFIEVRYVEVVNPEATDRHYLFEFGHCQFFAEGIAGGHPS